MEPHELDETVEPTKKMLSSDIVLELRGKEGKALSGSGILDKRLFTGENNLRARLDTQNMLWYLRYEKGILPEELQQRFTDFPRLMTAVKNYFQKRNVEVVRVRD